MIMIVRLLTGPIEWQPKGCPDADLGGLIEGEMSV